MVIDVEDPLLGSVLHAGIVPHIAAEPGCVRWTGPDIGAHTGKVLRDIAGLGQMEMDALRREGVI